MPGSTARLGLYLPGGGASGVYVPDEVADIDQLNNNFIALDGALGAPDTLSTGRPGSPFDGQLAYETDTGNLIRFEQSGSSWQYITQDTGWIPIVPASGVTTAASARIIDGVLYLQSTAARTAVWAAGQQIGTLPTSMLASITRGPQNLCWMSNGTTAVVTVTALTGVITLGAISGSSATTLALGPMGPIN